MAGYGIANLFELGMTMTHVLGLDRQFEFIAEDADDATSESENSG